MLFSSASISNKGDRANNEDAILCTQLGKYGCYAAADGLGGHEKGEVASSLACLGVKNAFEKRPGTSGTDLLSYLNQAQKLVLNKQNEDKALSPMRTTLAVLVTDYDKAAFAHIGDSRIYQFRSNKIIFRTRDHSVSQSLANGGLIEEKEIRFHEDRNKLLRVIGEKDDFRPSIREKETVKGDRFLICTDGFWELVLEEQMEKTLKNSSSPEQWLINMEEIIKSSSRSNKDNYSAIALFL
ncbi:MAG: protein phosphatase 2C domain-containing protein [Bacillota bacterium]|nr:protein phosphatase 2C domain-containing protein [Bacillota bacterium]